MTDANTTPSSLEFQEPSDEEARHYYVSFSTRPRQLGRTSSATKPWFFETWPPPDAHYPWGRGRELPGATAAGPVGNHRIHATWEVTTAQKVLEAICPLDWTCIDVLRIGRQADDEKDRPVIVWVGASSKSVICGETSWRLVKGVLERVRRAFDSDNLFNVECEVRQSDVHSSVSVGELGQGQGQDEGEIESKLRLLPLLHGHYQDRQRPVEIRPTQLISTSIGQAIVPNCSPGNVGSLGMYLMPADDNSDVVWALTARHVIVPDEFTKDGKSVPLPDIKVLLPPPETVKETRKQVEDIVTKTASEAGKDTYGNMWATHLARQQALLNQFRAREASPERCAIGTVQYAPDIRLNTLKTVPSYTRDWALISLDKKSFPFDFGFENVVDLRRHGDEEDHFLKEVKRALGEVSSQSSQAAQYSFPPKGFSDCAASSQSQK